MIADSLRRRKGLDEFPNMVLWIALAFMFAAVYFAAGQGWIEGLFDKLLKFEEATTPST